MHNECANHGWNVTKYKKNLALHKSDYKQVYRCELVEILTKHYAEPGMENCTKYTCTKYTSKARGVWGIGAIGVLRGWVLGGFRLSTDGQDGLP